MPACPTTRPPGTIAKAKELISYYKQVGVEPERVLIKIASTWEGIQALLENRLADLEGHQHPYADAEHLFADFDLDEAMREAVESRQNAWCNAVGIAQTSGIPVPGLAHFDSYRTASLPQNLTQAQRDAFGSHTYQRKDDPSGELVHTDWLEHSP